MAKDLELEIEEGKVKILLKDIMESKENLEISKKIFEIKFYEEFKKELIEFNLNEIQLQNIYYIFYNEIFMKEFSQLKKIKVLFISDGLKVIREIVGENLKMIFKEADMISSYIFEIYGYEKEVDMVISSEEVIPQSDVLFYKMSRFPSEPDIVDLKVFTLKKFKN